MLLLLAIWWTIFSMAALRDTKMPRWNKKWSVKAKTCWGEVWTTQWRTCWTTCIEGVSR